MTEIISIYIKMNEKFLIFKYESKQLNDKIKFYVGVIYIIGVIGIDDQFLFNEQLLSCTKLNHKFQLFIYIHTIR